MNSDNENRVEELARVFEQYLINNSLHDLAKLIVKNIPKIYYNRILFKLKNKNEI